MNLHAVVVPIIAAVNPLVPATMKISTGYTTSPDGTRVPTYDTASGMVQVQALNYKDLTQLDGINISGIARAIYFYGEFNGVVRARKKGGDIITLTNDPNAGDWLIVHELEAWVGWSKSAIVLQNPSGS